MSSDANTLSDPREQKTYYFNTTLARHVILGFVQIFFKLTSQAQVHGVENIPPSGPAILAANHMSNYDAFPIQFAIPRQVFFMGKEELFRNPLLDWLLRQLGGFPVYRGARDSWALVHAQHVLAKGLVLGIFPEGSRSKGHGLRTAKSGAARLSIATGCPIIPLAIDGSQYMFQNIPWRSKISIRVGQPIYPQADEMPISLTERMMFSIAEMLPPRQRGVYCSRPPGF